MTEDEESRLYHCKREGCRIAFRFRMQRDRHMRNCSPNCRIPCKRHCDKPEAIPSEQPKEGGFIQCSTCDKIYLTSSAFLKHELSCSKPPVIKVRKYVRHYCETCDEEYLSPSKLLRHQRSARHAAKASLKSKKSDLPPFSSVENCGKSNQSPEECHNNPNQTVLECRDKPNQTPVEDDMQIGEGQLKCCNKIFETVSALSNHELTCRLPKKKTRNFYMCTTCNECFPTPSKLERHEQSAKHAAKACGIARKTYVCTKCEKCYQSLKWYLTHIQTGSCGSLSGPLSLPVKQCNNENVVSKDIEYVRESELVPVMTATSFEDSINHNSKPTSPINTSNCVSQELDYNLDEILAELDQGITRIKDKNFCDPIGS